MRLNIGICGAAVALALGLSACSSGTPDLITPRNDTRSPDEFVVIPAKPLQMPEDLAALPAPTPGGANITDPTPEADAIAALGGNPAAVNSTTIPGSDGGIVRYAGRFGTAADIRQVLASEDLEYRRDNNGRLLQRVFNVTSYYTAYAPMSLDQYAELDRWRAAGARTPAAPPRELLEQ